MTSKVENVIYCDGSTRHNGHTYRLRSGIGAVMILSGRRSVLSRPIMGDSNHKVEIQAALGALIQALISHPEIRTQKVILYSDSEYFVDRFNFIHPIKTWPELWKEVRVVAYMYEDLEIRHILRTKGIGRNSNLHHEADRLAKLASGAMAITDITYKFDYRRSSGAYFTGEMLAGDMRQAIKKVAGLVPLTASEFSIREK